MMPRTQPDRLAVAAECGPGDRGVKGQVGQLVEDLVEPSAECRAGSLQPGQTAVGGVEHQGQRQRQARRSPGRSSRRHRRRSTPPPRASRPRRPGSGHWAGSRSGRAAPPAAVPAETPSTCPAADRSSAASALHRRSTTTPAGRAARARRIPAIGPRRKPRRRRAGS